MEQNDSLIDKLLCCNKKKSADSRHGSEKVNGDTRTDQPTWNVTQPVGEGNGLAETSLTIDEPPINKKIQRYEHVQLTRLTSDASALQEATMEPAEDLDPNVVEEVSHEELEQISSTDLKSKDGTKPGTSKNGDQGFMEIDLDGDVPSSSSNVPAGPAVLSSPRSIEEDSLSYTTSTDEEDPPWRPSFPSFIPPIHIPPHITSHRNTLNNTNDSVEEEYTRNKQSILKEIEEEDSKWANYAFNSDEDIPKSFKTAANTKIILPESLSDEEATAVPDLKNSDIDPQTAGKMMKNIEKEFEDIMSELDEESDEDVRARIEKRASRQYDAIMKAVDGKISARDEEEEPEIEREEEAKEKMLLEELKSSVAVSYAPGTRSPEEDSEEEIMLTEQSSTVPHNAFPSPRSDASPLPPPPVLDIPSATTPSSQHNGPLSSSSGFATSTMYSAASDDSDVSDGEELPSNKKLFESDEDEGTFDHLDIGSPRKEEVKKKEETNVSTISLSSTGAATAGGKEVKVNLSESSPNKSITDDEFSEKLI